MRSSELSGGGVRVLADLLLLRLDRYGLLRELSPEELNQGTDNLDQRLVFVLGGRRAVL
eukprot:CAMPEP_0171819736 /NCGR_PEP_ID=MMETSP0992-20121227/2375_1 /TAXON_ID=483369 /ORGANISM="non described non described, Strain CCMP2098" /LENGTH=58 /DNA_ID=CAMNT_0012434045 /DNA_START=41 /DNA_END=212 /DNA_ORIENTATION=+